MKTLLLSIILFFPTTCFSQWQIDPCLNINYHSVKQDKNESWKVIALYSGSIILNGIGDGLNDANHKTAGHLFNAASIGTLLVSPIVFNYQKDKWYWYLLSYISLRAGLFDITYNLTRKLSYNYIGSTSITDKFYNSLGVYPIYPRAIFFVIGFVIPIIQL
jgi:hypothetical protein